MKFLESCDLFVRSSYHHLYLGEKIVGGSLGCVFPSDQGEKELSWGKKLLFPIAVVCVHLKAFKIASKMGFFFPFLPWSSFTCSATHLGAYYLPPQLLPGKWVVQTYLSPRGLCKL